MDNNGTTKSQQDGQQYGQIKDNNMDTNKNDKEYIKNDKEKEEGKEEDCTVLPPISFPTSTHKLFLDRFGETAYRTWLMDKEFLEEDTVIKIFVEQEIYKTGLERFIDTLEILTNKKIEVEVRV
jgi:hypothetical protein